MKQDLSLGTPSSWALSDDRQLVAVFEEKPFLLRFE